MGLTSTLIGAGASTGAAYYMNNANKPQGQTGGYGQQQQPGQQAQYGQQYGQPPPQYAGQQQPAYGQYGQQSGAVWATGAAAGAVATYYGSQPGGQIQGGAGYGNVADPQYLTHVLQQCVHDQRLSAFYPPGSIEPIARRVAQSGAVNRIAHEWKLPMDLATELAKLALFDVILYVDDSGSMAFENGGERIEDLKLILSRVAYATSLFDHDGISVRLMNSSVEGNQIRTEQEALHLVSQVRFAGLTPLGTSLWHKILNPLVVGPAMQNRLMKPVVVITITDGSPAGEPKDEIFNVILRADADLKRTRYGPDAISYQFAQVGDDMKAMKFLAELDSHPVCGPLVDCTSNFEAEQEEAMRKSGARLDPTIWITKLLLGPISSAFDTKGKVQTGAWLCFQS
nr:hypothetical protein L203_01751 [Cryptococcus depauperatus CBS 7841]